MSVVRSGKYNKSGFNRCNHPVYIEEEYVKILSQRENEVPKRRGRPFGSKNTGIKKKAPEHCVKIEYKEIIISFD